MKHKFLNLHDMGEKKFVKKRIKAIAILAMLFLVGCEGDKKNERTWSVYKADANSSNYSPLDKINTSNVNQLQPAWTFKINDQKSDARPAISQCNPIIVDGVMFAVSAKQWAYAINAATGEQIWSFDPFDGKENGGPNRGVTYWESGNDKRILFAGGDKLFALDAKTGKPIDTFGEKGKVDLNIGVRDDPKAISVTLTTPGIIYQDLIIVGSRLPDLYGSPPGYVRAYNCKTGALVWTFHTIPLPGEAGNETWPKDAYQSAGGVNNWAGMSVDAKRGLVFMALGSPTYDFYGADRAGQNLYGNSVLALEASTGKYVWHFQTIHHDMWDYDLPAPPTLVTVRQNGKEIDAVAQLTKHGFVFVFNRETGESLFPIEERPVPKSNIPGEASWPTQPFPLKPKPFARQSVTEADLTNYSAADHDALVKQFRSLRYEGLFTPPDLKGTLMLPGTRGGIEWGGAAFDSATNILYFRSNDAPDVQTIIKGGMEAQQGTLLEQGQALYTTYCSSCHGAEKKGNPPTYPSLVNLKDRMTREAVREKIQKGAGVMPGYASVLNQDQQNAILAFVHKLPTTAEQEGKVEKKQTQNTPTRYLNTTGYITWKDPSGNPAIIPPWGTLHALNLSTGEYEWQIPLGNDEQRQAKGAPQTGQEGKAGPVVTAGGLIFISGSEDKKLRAFEKSTGKLLWETTLPAMANATACTYEAKGKQYVALSVGGTTENPSGFIMAFSLP
jgi:quinoprotein glucose dehydrogenase